MVKQVAWGAVLKSKVLLNVYNVCLFGPCDLVPPCFELEISPHSENPGIIRAPGGWGSDQYLLLPTTDLSIKLWQIHYKKTFGHGKINFDDLNAYNVI